MTEMSEYAPGTPSWVDLGTPDIAGASTFYAALFGWTVVDAGPPELTGDYRTGELRGRPVAGLGPQADTDRLPWWTTYVAVTDVDATMAVVERLGGRVVVPPVDVLTVGRMAMAIDPVGAVFALWQARDHIGAGITNEPGTLCWNELTCRDVDTARAFYSAVFGWDPRPSDLLPSGYTEWHLGHRSVGGLMQMNELWPADVPSHWMVYFAVADCDRSAERCTELGGAVFVPPTDIPPGRFAVLNDPYGAVFSIIALPAAAG